MKFSPQWEVSNRHEIPSHAIPSTSPLVFRSANGYCEGCGREWCGLLETSPVYRTDLSQLSLSFLTYIWPTGSAEPFTWVCFQVTTFSFKPLLCFRTKEGLALLPFLYRLLGGLLSVYILQPYFWWMHVSSPQKEGVSSFPGYSLVPWTHLKLTLVTHRSWT